MLDINKMQQSFLLDWAERFLSEDYNSFKMLARMFLSSVGGSVAFKSNLLSKDFKGIETIKSFFWKSVLCTWLNKRNPCDKDEINNFSPIFNNKNIRFKNEPIFLPQCFSSNIYTVGDIMSVNNLFSYEEFYDKYGKRRDSLLVYNVLFNAINKHMTSIKVIQNDTIFFNESSVGEIGRKGFYNSIRTCEHP